MTIIAGLTALAGAGGMAQASEVKGGNTNPEPTIEKNIGGTNDNRQTEISQEKQKKHFKNLEMPDFHNGFFIKNEKTNKIEFSLFGLIAPIQIEGLWTDEVSGKILVDLPFEYGRLFESAKALSPEGYKKAVNYIGQQMEQKIGENIIGLDISKKVHYAHETTKTLEGLTIKSIRVVGTTSPEGPAEKGPQTILPGNIDEENIKLGSLRADSALTGTQEAIDNLGGKVDKEMLNNNVRDISSKEIQFSDSEMVRLGELSKDFKGVTVEEKIFNMIVSHNNDEIKDKDLNDELVKIIDSKRTVEIEIEYEGNQKNRLLIPIPLFFLLIGPMSKIRLNWPDFHRKGKPKGDGTPPSPKPPKTPKRIPDPSTPEPEPGPKGDGPIEKPPKGFGPIIDKNPIPDGPEGIVIIIDTWVDDLYVYFDDVDKIKGGIN